MRVWLINYLEEPTPDVAATREMAYELAKWYLENMSLEENMESYRSVALKDLEDSYNESYDGDFGVVGYLNVVNLPFYT